MKQFLSDCLSRDMQNNSSSKYSSQSVNLAYYSTAAQSVYGKKDGFTQGCLVNEPLSPEQDFYIANSLIVIKRKMFQLAIDENQMVVTPKMTLIETFLRGHYVQWSF